MKLKSMVLAAGAILYFSSCNNSGEEAGATLPASTSKVAIIQHPIADYDHWRPIFDADDSARMSYGISKIGVGRMIDDPNQIIMYFRIEDTVRANACMNRPDLKTVMDSAGVTGPPSLEYVNVVRADTNQAETKDRVLVVEKVKDFDAWLKSFDKGGMELRKSFGMVDRAIARGMNDPNMVYIVFAITDWDKANARMNSEELKKIKADAGVEETTMVRKYKVQ